MNKRIFVFGIGGTGARILRSLTMLLAAGARVNNYFLQAGAGPIYRGNWIGLGLAAVL